MDTATPTSHETACQLAAKTDKTAASAARTYFLACLVLVPTGTAFLTVGLLGEAHTSTLVSLWLFMFAIPLLGAIFSTPPMSVTCGICSIVMAWVALVTYGASYLSRTNVLVCAVIVALACVDGYAFLLVINRIATPTNQHYEDCPACKMLKRY